ncbi:hypothetical protein ACA910_013141 [Epithemia clementina (nom. ined.)]
MRRMRSRHHRQAATTTTPPFRKSGKSLSVSVYNKARAEVTKQQQASAAFDLPSQPLVKTIGGGTAMIFAMARRMWEQEKADQEENDTGNENDASGVADSRSDVVGMESQTVLPRPTRGLFPRWRPTPTLTTGISNVNPNFRTQAPTMNSQGFASTIWRNVRKRNKPSLWRYALRTYDRMAVPPETSTTTKSRPMVRRTNEHYHGALLAAAKLGMWEKAFEIFAEVEQKQAVSNKKTTPFGGGSGNGEVNNMGKMGGNRYLNQKLSSTSVHVTDYMIVSVIYACVRASRTMEPSPSSSPNTILADRRRPLDKACKMLDTVQAKYGISVETRHYNPLAAAYLHLRLRNEAENLINRLKDRKIGPEPEDGVEPFNINDIGTKDKASYTLLVSGAVQEDDWTSAVDALRNMTESGLYPNQRHLNAWNEVSERKTKHRTTRSWKKKRDELWIERGLR